MREVVEQVLAQFWVVLHHRYIVLISVAIICAIGWTGIEFIPDKYQAETKVYLDTQSMLTKLLKGLAADSDAREHSAQVMQRTLITRPNMQKVILETNLNLSVNGPQETEKMIDSLIQDIEIKSISLLKKKGGGSNLYRISYTHEDPEITKEVIVVLLNIFVESILGETRKDTNSAEEFLDEQIREYERRQYDAEERLKNFKQKNMGFMPEEGRSHYQTIARLDSSIETTTLELVEKENQILELKRQIKSLVTSASGFSSETGNAIPHPLDLRISELQANLDELLLQYTDNHPDVVNSRLILKQLEEKKSQMKQKGPEQSESVDSSVLGLPLYQELNVMLSAAQSEAVALRTRLERYKNQRDDKTGLLSTITEVEAELANLNRDYDINKKMYEQLVSRRESSNLALKAEQTGDKLQFKIIEPPRVPHVPFSPNRLLLTSLTLLIAVGGGVGAAILFEQVKPTFYTRNQLIESMDIPVLGVVSMFWTPEEKRKRHLDFMAVGLVAIFLLGTYVGVMAHNGLNVPILSSIL